jgi:tRNA G18 (ribose-2'-O)-methylase SpoU
MGRIVISFRRYRQLTMAELIDIDDPADPRVDDFRDLTTADRRPDRPGGRGLVIAEGTVVVERLLASPYPVRSLLGVGSKYEALASALASVDVPYHRTSAEVMAAVVGFHLNRGVLAVADRVAFPPAAELVRGARTVAVLEGVGDHENLGSIFRNAAALGVDAVLLLDGCADPLYRRSVRVSMGNVLKVPFAPLTGDVGAALESLQQQGFTVAALTPRAGARPLLSFDRGSSPLALLLGSEGPGLSEAALAASDVWLRIPMATGVDSLNVATAGAVAFATLAAPGE